MGDHHEPRVRINLKSFLKSFRIHVPSVILCVNKYSAAVFVGDRVYGGIKSQVTGEYGSALQGSLIRSGLTIELFPRQFRRKMKRCRSCAESYGVFHPYIVSCHLFDLVNILPDCAHPVGIISLHHISGFLSVHSGTGEIDMSVKRSDLCRAFKGHFLYSSALLVSDSLL